jgi:cephalosporin hydroxylase
VPGLTWKGSLRMDELRRFSDEVRANIDRLMADADIQALSRAWLTEITRHKYTYNFGWLGRPVIQLPQDLLAVQEIVWRVKPDLVVETGIAHGGSLIHSASLLELLGGDGLVIGVDVDIRAHNRREIEAHPLAKRIRMIEGSSTDPSVVAAVSELARGRPSVLVMLDSDHTHAHVLRELQLYAPLVTRGSYLVVFDTLIEDLPDELFTGRRWGKGNNPKTAVWQFLATTDRFEIDARIAGKLLLTCAPDGYLRCTRD